MAEPRREPNRVGAGHWPTLWARLRSLRAQILLWTILPIAIFLLGLSFTDVYGHQRAMRVMIEERDSALVQAVAERIADDLWIRADLLAAVGAGTEFGQADPATQDRLLAALTGSFPDGVVALAGDGQLFAAGAGATSWGRAPWVRSLAAGAVAQGKPLYLATGQEPSAPFRLAIAVPLPGRAGALVGLLPLSHSSIAAAVDGLQLVPQAQASLLDAQGQPIYQAGQEPIQAAGDGPRAAPVQASGDTITTTSDVPNAGWRVVLAEPWQHLVPLVLRYSEATVLVAVAAALISLLAVYSGVRYVTRPLQELGQQARRLAWGDFEAIREPVGGVAEIADLQNTLRQMAAQVREYQTAMRSYVAAVTQAQEEERLRLARELHDDTVQSLIALGQRLERAQKAVAQSPDQCHRQMDELRRAVRSLVQDVRRLIGDLRPIYLDDLGLVPALETLVKGACPACQPLFTIRGQVRRLGSDLELAIYRIVQAALRNVEQHARASKVQVTLDFEEQAVRVVVEDDGIGFVAPSSPDDLARQGHFGLLGMRERATLFGGWLALHSQPGRGTRLEAYLPTSSATEMPTAP